MVRTRFAPSPTGLMHVGGLRTAVYNYIYAQKKKGKFILRIEDTDRERFVEGATQDIISSMTACGIDYDEGPDKKAKFGPYYQSQRLELYQKHAQVLMTEGKAYKCYCSADRLEKMREQQMARKLPPKYDRHCLNLPAEELAVFEKNKATFVVRFKIPDQGQVVYQDLVKGEVRFSNLLLEDFVMIKSDGYPTYHLANIIDDHFMEITHVIRGDEWLSSLPKHILLYQAFGWKNPEFAHIPLLLNKDRSKLSKRQGDVSVHDYLAKGYLPEALVNFVALLGWNPGTEEEIFDLKGLIKAFNIEQINKSGAVFDLEKLDWMNGYYIRHKKIEDLVELSVPYLVKAELIAEEDSKLSVKETGEAIAPKRLGQIIKLEQERLKKLSDLPEATSFFFKAQLDYPVEMLLWKNTDTKKIKMALSLLLGALEKVSEKDFTGVKLNDLVKQLAIDNGLKNGEVFWPWRVSLTGREASPGPQDISEILGKEGTLERLRVAISRIK